MIRAPPFRGSQARPLSHKENSYLPLLATWREIITPLPKSLFLGDLCAKKEKCVVREMDLRPGKLLEEHDEKELGILEGADVAFFITINRRNGNRAHTNIDFV